MCANHDFGSLADSESSDHIPIALAHRLKLLRFHRRARVLEMRCDVVGTLVQIGRVLVVSRVKVPAQGAHMGF